MNMHAFNITLKSGEILTIYPNNGPCEISVAGNKMYSLIADKNSVDLIIHIPVNATLVKAPFNLDIVSIQHIEDNRKEVLELNATNNCCTIGTKEWCVRNGCMDAPCGRICG